MIDGADLSVGFRFDRFRGIPAIITFPTNRRINRAQVTLTLGLGVVIVPHPDSAMLSSEKDNQIRIPAISTFRIEGGKLVEGWELYDSGDAVEQLMA